MISCITKDIRNTDKNSSQCHLNVGYWERFHLRRHFCKLSLNRGQNMSRNKLLFYRIKLYSQFKHHFELD